MSRKLDLLLQETNRKDAALEIVREKFGSLIFCTVGSFFHGVHRINFSDTDILLNKCMTIAIKSVFEKIHIADISNWLQ